MPRSLQPSFRSPPFPGSVPHFLDARKRALGEKSQQRLEIERRMERELERELRARVGRPRPELRRRAAESSPDGFVEAVQAPESRRVRDVDDAQRRRLQELPRQAEPARAEHLGRGRAQVAGEQPPQMAVGHTEAVCQSRGLPGLLEQPQRPGERRGRPSLRRRPGDRVRTAAHARAEPGRLGGGGGGEQDHVLAARQARRAAGPAVDVGRAHAQEEAAGESPVASIAR
jgi:hypothetical protein